MVPTFGVAKNLLYLDKGAYRLKRVATKENTSREHKIALERSKAQPLRSGRDCGWCGSCEFAHEEFTFVSPDHLVTLETAVEITLLLHPSNSRADSSIELVILLKRIFIKECSH
nr:hypothetical transcript [Hymenolepis microstoma]